MTSTARLYYTDSYLRGWEARVSEVSGNRVYLDRTAFYPSSGGQPFDLGLIGDSVIEDVIDEGDRIAHVVAAPVSAGVPVHCKIDWSRRFDHMQQHTGQHLLSAVLVELFGVQTVSFHLGSDLCTIDVATPSLEPAQIVKAERRTNEIVFENRQVGIAFADNNEDLGLRKASEREGELRIVSIEDLDRSACGGTHVRSTAEIGPVAIRKLDKIRGNVRIEFLCGMRAIARARADFEALSKIARQFSSSLDDAPAVSVANAERLMELEKTHRKLAAEAAQRQGRDLYTAADPGPDGLRRVIRDARIDDELRAIAQGFVAGPKAVFIALCTDPPSVLVAASKDSGVHAGELVKAAVTEQGGRGGGSPVLGQGSVRDVEALEKVRARLVAN